MNVLCVLIVAVFGAGVFVPSAPPSCPAERPVDDIINELHKQESKMRNRNKNPFPDPRCIFGWCRDDSRQRTPPTFPDPGPPKGTSQNESASSENESSSAARAAVDKCNEAIERALQAAHDAEVGDDYFADKKYNAALLRYKDADGEKPGDAAIHVRLGRVFEKLGQPPQAVEQYKAAQELGGPAKWSHEAEAALARLQHR